MVVALAKHVLGDQKGGRVLKRYQSGFSLIELMIALVIMTMLLLAGAPSFSAFLQNRKIRNAATAVSDGLGLAKAEAVRRNTNVSFALDGASGWVVGCTTPSADGTSCPASIKTRSSNEGSADIATTATNLIFNGYGRVSSLAAGVNATIDVSNTLGTCETLGGNMRCLRLTVTPGGLIRMCDPKLTVTNPTSPQAC